VVLQVRAPHDRIFRPQPAARRRKGGRRREGRRPECRL